MISQRPGEGTVLLDQKGSAAGRRTVIWHLEDNCVVQTVFCKAFASIGFSIHQTTEKKQVLEKYLRQYDSAKPLIAHIEYFYTAERYLELKKQVSDKKREAPETVDIVIVDDTPKASFQTDVDKGKLQELKEYHDKLGNGPDEVYMQQLDEFNSECTGLDLIVLDNTLKSGLNGLTIASFFLDASLEETQISEFTADGFHQDLVQNLQAFVKKKGLHQKRFVINSDKKENWGVTQNQALKDERVIDVPKPTGGGPGVTLVSLPLILNGKQECSTKKRIPGQFSSEYRFEKSTKTFKLDQLDKEVHKNKLPLMKLPRRVLSASPLLRFRASLSISSSLSVASGESESLLSRIQSAPAYSCASAPPPATPASDSESLFPPTPTTVSSTSLSILSLLNVDKGFLLVTGGSPSSSGVPSTPFSAAPSIALSIAGSEREFTPDSARNSSDILTPSPFLIAPSPSPGVVSEESTLSIQLSTTVTDGIVSPATGRDSENGGDDRIPDAVVASPSSKTSGVGAASNLYSAVVSSEASNATSNLSFNSAARSPYFSPLLPVVEEHHENNNNKSNSLMKYSASS